MIANSVMNKPLKVLHIVGSMDRGGVETWLMRMFRVIDLNKIQFSFCCLGDRPGEYSEEISARGGKIYVCNLNRNLAKFMKEFRMILGKGEYNVVHSHVHFFSGVIVRLAKNNGVNVRISHSHNTRDSQGNNLYRKFYRRLMRSWINKYSNARVAVSAEAATALFGSSYTGDSNLAIIRCGIDLLPFKREAGSVEVRKNVSIPEGSLVVGHIGRFSQQKNHKYILDIALEIIKLVPNAYFLLVGDGPLKKEFERHVKKAGIESAFRFVGIRADIPSLLSAMDVFIMPSLYEGLPVAALEAQAAGLPTILSDRITKETVAIPELVQYLSIDADASIWAQIIVNHKVIRRVSGEEREIAFANSGFLLSASIDNLTNLYHSCLSLDY